MDSVAVIECARIKLREELGEIVQRGDHDSVVPRYERVTLVNHEPFTKSRVCASMVVSHPVPIEDDYPNPIELIHEPSLFYEEIRYLPGMN